MSNILVKGLGVAVAAATITLTGISGANATETPYTLVAWVIPGGDTTQPFAEPQPIATYEYTSVDSLEGLTLECGTTYQIDLYTNNDATDALISGGFLNGPSDPLPEQWAFNEGQWRGMGLDSTFVTTEPCTEPVVEYFDESACVGATQYRTLTYKVTDGVESDRADFVSEITQGEAIELGCYEVPVVVCEGWMVPGVLDGFGNPTSCVSNHPCPGLEAPECVPVEVPEVPTETVIPVEHVTPTVQVKELAYTGSNNSLLLLGGLGILGLGIGATFIVRRFAV